MKEKNRVSDNNKPWKIINNPIMMMDSRWDGIIETINGSSRDLQLGNVLDEPIVSMN
jgi:hypothetical protein